MTIVYVNKLPGDLLWVVLFWRSQHVRDFEQIYENDINLIDLYAVAGARKRCKGGVTSVKSWSAPTKRSATVASYRSRVSQG